MQRYEITTYLHFGEPTYKLQLYSFDGSMKPSMYLKYRPAQMYPTTPMHKTVRKRRSPRSLAFWTRLPVGPRAIDTLPPMRIGALLVGAAALGARAHESFHETLDLHTLPGGRVHAAFSFAMHADDASLRHFRVLPRALLQPVASLDVEALQLTLTAGRWQYATWGAPAGSQAVATGAEVWASFASGHALPRATRWRRLTSALAGTFCASLDAIDDTTSVQVPARYVWSDAPSNASVLHAYLPSESVCTENLTPLLKLLPCKGGAGLASLLQMHTVLAAEFHSISVQVRRAGEGYTVVLGVTTVMRPERRPREHETWTLERLFSRELTAACPVADRSEVRVEAPRGAADDDDDDDEAAAAADAYRVPLARHTYDTTSLAPYGGRFALTLDAPAAGPLLAPPPLQATRQVLGYGQERNLVRLTLRNTLPTETVHVVYYDQLPWVVAPLMHTLRTSLALDEAPEEAVRYRDELDTPFVTDAHYRPATLRARTGAVELVVRVPARSTLTVSYVLTKRVLHYDEHVPDPHRGIDLPPALFVPRGVPRRAHAVQPARMYAPPSLLDIAVPDFSMPYNIILFYSTFVALFFGSLLNVMVRRFYDVVV